MKKGLMILFILSALLIGCKSEAKVYGDMIDWSEYPSVKYAVGKDGVYSDGSWESNVMYDAWVDKYEQAH